MAVIVHSKTSVTHEFRAKPKKQLFGHKNVLADQLLLAKVKKKLCEFHSRDS